MIPIGQPICPYAALPMIPASKGRVSLTLMLMLTMQYVLQLIGCGGSRKAAVGSNGHH